jgi:hypothetical protein
MRARIQESRFGSGYMDVRGQETASPGYQKLLSVVAEASEAFVIGIDNIHHHHQKLLLSAAKMFITNTGSLYHQNQKPSSSTSKILVISIGNNCHQH